jgi:hypothetical protein
MRSKREVLQRFEELRATRLKKRKDEFLTQSPQNCRHNARMRVKGKGVVGFCQNPNVLKRCDSHLFVCDEELTASRCRVFECRNDEASVERDFEEILASPSRCGNEYPKLAIMIWFLQEYESTTRGSRLKYEWSKLLSSIWRMAALKWW